MPETSISSAVASDLTNAMTAFAVPAVETEGAGDQKETTWQMSDWSKNLGYYKKIPELKVAIDTEAIWIMGGGIKVDEQTELLLGTIKGHGKDSFN